MAVVIEIVSLVVERITHLLQETCSIHLSAEKFSYSPCQRTIGGQMIIIIICMSLSVITSENLK